MTAAELEKIEKKIFDASLKLINKDNSENQVSNEKYFLELAVEVKKTCDARDANSSTQ